MKARDFVKPAAELSMEFDNISVPKTIEELENAINFLFENLTNSKKPVTNSELGLHRDHPILLANCTAGVGQDLNYMDSWFCSEQDAVIDLWNQVIEIRMNKPQPTPKMIEDEISPKPPTYITWQKGPELKKNKNGCISVSFKASFF